jgi:hypothetical protein
MVENAVSIIVKIFQITSHRLFSIGTTCMRATTITLHKILWNIKIQETTFKEKP